MAHLPEGEEVRENEMLRQCPYRKPAAYRAGSGGGVTEKRIRHSAS